MKISPIRNVNFGKNIQNLKNRKDNETLKGVLLNNYIQKQATPADDAGFGEIQNYLLIPEKIEVQKEKQEKQERKFDLKQAFKPIAIASGATLLSILGISTIIGAYSKKIASKKGVVLPPDLARNFNILQEPHFALYRALREPTGRNLFGLFGVCAMSAMTLAAKTFVDGYKEVWVKKQLCDIENDFQNDVIEAETKAFSGKLDVVNTMLKDNSEYFKSVLSDKKQSIFGNFLNFKGNIKDKDKDEKKTKKIKTALMLAATSLAFAGLSYLVFRNCQKTAKNLDIFEKKYADAEIKRLIQDALEKKDKKEAIESLSDIMKVINATEETMKSKFSEIKGITNEEIISAIDEVKKAQIYIKAPEALGGVSEKIQYYCYIDEERGHLYNWILNPENPFNKYLFIGFSLLSSLSYISHTAADAIKQVTVAKEASKADLNLRYNLADTEIRNFKSKKESAVNPLIDNFNLQMQKGKSKEELREIAQNILIEIKNGPPYVYT